MTGLKCHEDQSSRASISHADVVGSVGCVVACLHVASEKGDLEEKGYSVDAILFFVGAKDENDVNKDQHSYHHNKEPRVRINHAPAWNLKSGLFKNEAAGNEDHPVPQQTHLLHLKVRMNVNPTHWYLILAHIFKS